MEELSVKRVLSGVVLSLLFALTGMAMALPGVTLPAVAQYGRLDYSHAGLLMMMLFAGSMCGALVAHGLLERRLREGTLAMAVGAACVALPGWMPGVPRGVLFCGFAGYGVGLGMTMTSISLLLSRRSSTVAVAEQWMSGLNLLWAVGAVSTPLAYGMVTRYVTVWAAFAAMAAVGLCALVWVLAVEMQWAELTRRESGPLDGKGLRRTPWTIGAMALLAVGVEASAGSWLGMMYAQVAALDAQGALSITMYFWLGLMVARAIHATPLPEILPGIFAPWVGLLLGLAGAWTLVAWQGSMLLLLPGALLLGYGIGPVYPRLIAVAVKRYRGNSVFVLAGIGSSLLPWVTGRVSSASGSVRSGFAVPAVAVTVLLGLALARVVSGEDSEVAAVGIDRASTSS